MRKLILLSDASNIHTQKWAVYFRDRNFEVHIITLLPSVIQGVEIHLIKSKAYAARKNNMEYNKFKVLIEAVPQVRKLIKRIKPDLVHAHFASSYGLFGALSGFHPYLVSVWGYDTIRFPETSAIHKSIIKYVLKKADRIFATSEFLAEKTARYTDKEMVITPFGVDIDLFKPVPKEKSDKFIFGTVKALEVKYGIDYLLEAVAKIKDKISNWELWIVGTGTQRDELIKLSEKLGISDNVKFLGRIPNKEVPKVIQQMEIFTVTSVFSDESFGVAAVEASAMQVPVIASRLGGLTEVVINNLTGYHVEARNSDQIADKIMSLYANAELRRSFGKNGRENVIKKYVWKENAEIMYNEYILQMNEN